MTLEASPGLGLLGYALGMLLIEKHVEQGRTQTTVCRLNDAGRVDELSRMLGGASVTPQIRRSAEEILRERQVATPLRPQAKGEINAKGESENPVAAKAKTPERRSPRRTGA